MKAQDAIRTTLTFTKNMANMYLQDLSDADLLVRPVPNANHIAWQLGHLIMAESGMSSVFLPGVAYPALPAGFAEQHNKDAHLKDTGFATKAVYLDLFNKVRQATIEAADELSEADLDKPTSGRVAQIAPTVGALLLLNGNHVMMHAGQWSVVRRKLGKPVLL
ncbi:MAG TPA: DinB family protein [Gemmataceae bacterium]|nr:DinB family protein [Gemmataceae bacterium]